MNHLRFPGGQRVLCIILTAILIWMLLPLGRLPHAQLRNPITDGAKSPIDALLLGEGDQSISQTIPNTEPAESQPHGTQPDDSQETCPPETVPVETRSSEQTQPGIGDGDQGQEDGIQGEEGGREEDPELALVMTWYRYGSQKTSLVCGPSGTVTGSLNTAQLPGDELTYSFSLTGTEAKGYTILSTEVRAGDGAWSNADSAGAMTISLPQGGVREYTFRVLCRNESGEELYFVFVLSCFRGADLELELSWQTVGGSDSLRCIPGGTAAKTVKSRDLTEHVFLYTPSLTGGAADQAELIRGSYTTGSGESGELSVEGGTLVLKPGEQYDMTFEVSHEGMTLYFRFVLEYSEAADVDLSFTWLERGSIPRTLRCMPDSKAEVEVKSNQLSAGAVKYELELTGEDAANARILNISYTSQSGGGKLEKSGAIPMSLPQGASENVYTVLVSVLVNGQQLKFEIVLHYTMDVSLQMNYTMNNGERRTVVCENGKTRTAEPIYDDELENGLLAYEMKLTGSAGEGMEITAVQCYQSGSGRTVKLDSKDSVTLLLKNGKTGENTFTVTAKSGETEYTFTINIPYKHRGEKNVKIQASLREGQTIINGTEVNLSVSAWTEDGGGKVVGYIPAQGTDTKLIVTFDGEILRYVSTSGSASEYILLPKNPDVGDTNEHILHIYAEDAWGNYGEQTIRLQGQRNQSGQKTGTATIYVDMTVVGLGIVDSVRYDVLADEPISYSIGKAVFGMDLGEPYGAAKDTLGWKAKYTGTLDAGFYLQSLTPGIIGKGLEGSAWNQYGSNEEEILAAIDAKFGRGTGLATLWRCYYRNGLNKSGTSGGTYGEFDYTSGAGWLFSLDGVYYPGLSMCQYALEDGDVLTLRYSLAYGWDVGGGTQGYGNTAGYCVTALNGNYTISHRMETVEQPDGSLVYQCHCCGLREACAHQNIVCNDLGDGSHIRFCTDCRTAIGDPQEHIWDQKEHSHTCTDCSASEEHRWKEVEGSNTATCTESGTRTRLCIVCAMVVEEEAPPRGHALNSRWNHTKTEHDQKCSVCQQIIPESRGDHRYEYHAGDNDWYCTVCDAGHEWDYCGNTGLTVASADCTRIVYHCGDCGLDLTKNGSFPEYHQYENGICTHCGAADPDYIPPTQPPVTEPSVTEPPVTEPPETQPPTEPNRKDRRKRNES